MSHQVGLNIQEYPMVKEDKHEAEGGTKSKGRCFQQSTSNQKENLKALTTRLEDRIFYFGEQKHAAEFMKNQKAFENPIKIKYKNCGTEMATATKNMDKPINNVPEVLEDTSIRADIFISQNKYK